MNFVGYFSLKFCSLFVCLSVCLFVQTINDLRELLEQYNITDIRERGFETNFGLEPLAKPLFVSELVQYVTDLVFSSGLLGGL